MWLRGVLAEEVRGEQRNVHGQHPRADQRECQAEEGFLPVGNRGLLSIFEHREESA